jgi:hypothetical protein
MTSRSTIDVGVQTETRETNISYEGSSDFGLQGSVYRWTYQKGGLNLWNHAINKQFQEAVTSGHVTQLRQLKKDLESMLTTGKNLLGMMDGRGLSGFSKGIQPRDVINCIRCRRKVGLI